MKQLWAPWRMEYILANKIDGCFFCIKMRENRDRENYILYRAESNFVIMNVYPYNTGHLLVVPYKHSGRMEDLTREEMGEHLAVVNLSMMALKKAFQAQGFNIGMNIGKVAGAGVEDHLHTHIVPRWEGDTNYMPVLADVKVMPEALSMTYDKLKDFF